MRAAPVASRGISLLEVLMVVAIVTVLSVLAIPGALALFDRVRVSTAAAEFRAALAFTRAAAVRRQQRVDLLPATPAGWQSGWRVVVDLNNNQRVDPGEPVLRTSPPVPGSVEIRAQLRDGTRDYLAFNAAGRPCSAHSASVPQFGSLLFSAGDERRKIVIGFLGRARLCDPDRDRTAC